MNRSVTSKEELLATAKSIVFQEGIQKLNIRYLAKKSQVSVGSVYNYFSSKSDLVIGVMEEFWRIVFHDEICKVEGNPSFPDFFEKVYEKVAKNMEDFKSVFLGPIGTMNAEDSIKAKTLMDHYIDHMHQGFLSVLEKDSEIPSSIWTEGFTQEQFISFTLSQLLNLLTEEAKDCAYFKEIMSRILYPTSI